MVNPQRGEVLVRLADGKEHVLRYDLNAVAAAEEAIGRPLYAMKEGGLGLREIRALLWAGLLHAHRGRRAPFTLEDAGNLASLDSLADVAGAVTRAIRLALGKEEGGDAPGEAEPAPNGAGTPSSSTSTPLA